ncbi:hypothetical protein PUR71_00360, partial [Streptomyces sp. SP17BM10]|uniref:hypothetical protein n=1 Tax=Streptomyces sp. SP17BM10 TaxID=3002530 RepID=UPI002E7882D8
LPDTPEATTGEPPPRATGTLRREDGGRARLLTSAATAHAAGTAVTWPSAAATGVRVPTNAIQHPRFWRGPAPPAASPHQHRQDPTQPPIHPPSQEPPHRGPPVINRPLSQRPHPTHPHHP